jgi:hypothetical protein
MSGEDLVKSLQASYTGAAKIAAIREVLVQKPKMTGQELYELLLEKNADGALTGTLAKARLMLAGRYVMPIPSFDPEAPIVTQSRRPGTRITAEDLKAVERDTELKQVELKHGITVRAPVDQRRHPPPGVVRSDFPEPYDRPSVSSVDVTAPQEDRELPRLVPSDKYTTQQARDMAEAETTDKDREKLAKAEPAEVDEFREKKVAEMTSRLKPEEKGRPVRGVTQEAKEAKEAKK